MVAKLPPNYRRSRQFNKKTYVEYEHFYHKNQAEQYLEKKRNEGYHVRLTEGVIPINGKSHPYFVLWMLKTEYLKWKEEFERSLYGKHYDRIINKR